MVSLTNFKLVDQELAQHSFRAERTSSEPRLDPYDKAQSNSTLNKQTHKSQVICREKNIEPNGSSEIETSRKQATIQCPRPQETSIAICPRETNSNGAPTSEQTIGVNKSNRMQSNIQLVANDLHYITSDEILSRKLATSNKVSAVPAPNFVVTWRNLKFSIEPKWHEKLVAKKITFAHSNTNQPIERKLVLDELDGTFRSGELTAILGPSG